MARYKIIILILFLSSLTFAQSYPDQHVDFLVKKGIGEIMDQKYVSATNTFLALDQAYPHLPFGKLYLTAVLITKSNDLALPLEKDKIEKYLEEAETLTEAGNEKSPLWRNYFYGMIHGYRAYYSALEGKWFSTFTDGINAVNYFENCLKIDSSFNEALIAIGTYKYWKSVKAAWLPFFSDERSEGFHLLNKGIEKESYDYASGVVSLLWIYIDRKKSLDAIALADEALKKFPNNRNFKWALAHAYEDIDRMKAIEIYRELLASYSGEKQINRINEVVLKHKIAQDYERLGDYKNALRLCDDILFKKKFSNYEKQVLEERLQRVLTLRQSLTSLVKEK
ncbi:MAG: hypothetical protein Q8N83_01460 [Ignavibacteria bacterium]|nr:hypothetical protein [Ignavibacteria bacterium]